MRIKQVPPVHRALLRRVSATACGLPPIGRFQGTVGGVGFLVWEGSPLPRPVAETTSHATSFDVTRIDLASPAISTVTFGLLLFALLLLLRPVLTED
jgi:hypothetical protein